MAILVRLWGQVAQVDPGAHLEEIERREAATLEQAQGFAEELRIKIVNRHMSWPTNVGLSHIDLTFETAEEARAYNQETHDGDGYKITRGGLGVVEHEF